MHSSGLTQRRQDSAAPDYPLGQLFPGPFPRPRFRTPVIRNDPRNEPRSCIKIELIDTGHMEPLSCGRKMRLLAELHRGRIARIRVAGGGAEGDAPDPQASALGFPFGKPKPPTRPSPSRPAKNHGGVLGDDGPGDGRAFSPSWSGRRPSPWGQTSASLAIR